MKPRTIYEAKFGVRWCLTFLIIFGFGIYGLTEFVANCIRWMTE